MPHTSSLSPDSLHPGHASDHFDHLCAAQTLRSIVAHHRRLCAALELRPARFPEFYPKLKANLQSWKAQGLLAKFDKRASHKCYNQGYACVDTKVLVIGAGPCGLRAAIEAQLLGAKVLVLEKRDRFSRNNVLHLWPMVIHDLKALGAKKFFGKFCAGAIDHISIRQLQCILLKVALLLGVEFHENVGFEELIEPGDDETGWRARLSPPDHPAADFQFDVLVGADGKRNTFKCFRRKEFRGKLAIAITANFVNRHTEAEARVDEISGVAFIFNQKFFKDLSAATGIDLENIVYYKDDTHYFVMTAKKHSLLAKGVILKDYMDTGQLLAPSNIDRAQLMEFAREAADFSTDFQLPELKFAVNHYGLEDLAMFDFTCMYASCYASTAIVRHGHGLLLQLVGDSLLEPFWPTGSGCARGFLSCFDAAWQMRSWANPRLTALECLAEREATYRLLAQTTPKNLSGDLSGYSLDPRTRYPNLNTQAVMPHQVRHMVDTDSPEALAAELVLAAAAAASAAPPGQAEMPAHKRPFQPIEPTILLRWCRRCLGVMNIDVADLETDFQSGEAICGLVHLYRPELLQLSAVPELPLDRWRLALRLLQSELPVPAGVTPELLAEGAAEAHQLLELLSRVYDALHAPPPPAAAPRHPWLTEMASEDGDSLQRASPVPRLAADGRAAAANGDTMRRHRKRKSEAAHQRASRMTPEVKKAPKQAEPELSKKEQFASKVKDLEAKFSGTYQPPDKKPKPVSRVIGRIEKDWSLQQIERKIEENSRPFVNRDKEYPVPRWNRDAFDDKFQTIQSLSGGDVIPFRRFDYGQRGSSHVSAMAARFGNGHRPSGGAGSAVTQGAGGVAAYEPCHFCGQRVFLVDRMVAQQKFFHPKCFRCEYCSVALKPGNYEYDGDAGRFFCLPHFGLHSLVKNKYQRSETTSTVPPCPSPVIEQMRASHLSLRGATPERAEFENSVCDPMSEDELLSEMDEDEWTDRNFLTTEEVLSGGDCSDSDSCSPDSDQFEPALDDDEVLQLAEQWRRLHDPPAQDTARAETEPDSDRHESDGAGRAGDVSDTGQHSETEEETSARLRRRAEDGLTERVLQSRRVRKRTDVRDSQSSGSERATHRPAGDSSSAESDTEVVLRTPPQLPTSPTSPPPRIVIQVADRLEVPDPGQRPEPIGAERDSSGSGSGSGSVSGERPPSQERSVVSEKGAARGYTEGKSPKKEIGKKIVGSIPVLKKPVASLMGRNAGKPAAVKSVTTARVSISTLVQQKPVRPTSVSSEDSPNKPTRNLRRNSAQRSRPPTSDSASWRNSTELKRQSLVGPPSSAPAAPAPARSRSAADLGSRLNAATGRGQQTARGAAIESPRKSVVSRQASADATRSPPSKIPTRPQPSPRTSVTNGAQRPVAARRSSPPERKTSAPAKLMTEKSETKPETAPAEEKTDIGNVGNTEAGNKGKTETGKLGKSAPIRRGSGGNRVAAIAARDRVRRQVRENMLKQRMARKAREEANKSNGRHTGARRRRSRGDEARVGTGRSDDAVDQAAGEEKRERRLSMEEEESGERHRRRGSDGREDGDATSGSSGERNINSPPRARRKGGDKLSSSPDKSSSVDSASEAISGCETSVEVRLPGPDRDVRMHSSSEDERSNSEQEVVDNDGSDEYASPAHSDTDVRSTAKTRNFRDSRHSQENIPRSRDCDERRLRVEDETDDIHLSLSGAEEFDDVALEERWKQMLGDDDELMEAGDLDDMLKPKLNSPPKEAALKPVRVTEIDKLWDDAESEDEERSPSTSHVTTNDQVERPGEEGDTYVEFDALLNDVDVTNLERGFDGICDQTASTEDLSHEEDDSRGKITASGVTHSDREQSDDEERYADLTRRDTAKVSEHYSSHHSDTASDVSHDSCTDRNEPLYDRPSAHRDLHSPESPEHAEDTAWVTADSATLDDRVISETDDDEETAWRTAETTTLDTKSPASPREERPIAPEDCALPEDEESMSEEQEKEEPPRKPTSVLQDDDASSSDLEDRIHKRSRGQEQDDSSDHDTSKSSRRFNLDESFITFRRRRPEASLHRDTSTRSRSSSPDVIEARGEVSPAKGSPAASPPPIIDSPHGSPEPTRLGRNIEKDSDLGIEASMEYNQHWVDEWRDVDETTGTWMSQARREQERQRKREEDLSIEMEPAVDEVIVTETRAVSSDEAEARPDPSEPVVGVDEDSSAAMPKDVVAKNSVNPPMEVDMRPQKKPETREAVETKDEISTDADQYVVIVDEKFNRSSAIQQPMEMPKSKLNGSHATPLRSSAEQRSPSPDVLPHLKLFGGDETIDIVCERKRSAEKRGAPQRASLRERIKAIETAPAPAVSRPSEIDTSTEPTPDSRVESRLAALRDAKKPAATAARGPAATSTPMGTARAPLTTLPTPISETEQTPDQSVPSAVFRLIHQTPDSEPAGPVWDWETPCRPRAPPSAPPPPIPDTDSGPVSLEPAFLDPTPTWVSVSQGRGAVQPLPALSAPAAVLAATAAAAAPVAATPAAHVTSPVLASVASPATASVAPLLAPVAERMSSSVTSPSSVKISVPFTTSTDSIPVSVASRISSTSATPAAASVPVTTAAPKTNAVSPTSPLLPDFVSAATPRTRLPPVRVNSLVNKIWPPVSAAESAAAPVWGSSLAAADGTASRAGASAEPRSPAAPVSPASPAAVALRVPPTKPAKPILPALPLSTVDDASRTPIRRASPKITTITFPWFETATPVSPISPTVPSTPPTPATPTISAPPSTPTTPSGPPFRATRIRVSPLVEEASARLLRRGATDPSLVIPPRSALSGAPMRLSRLPEDLPRETQEQQERMQESQESQQERPPEESLIRDLVLSRVRRSPEKQFRKRVTSPALLGSSGPSVRPLPPPVPGEEMGGEADGETIEVIPPPPLTATRRLPPPPPPPPVEETERAVETEEGKVDGQTDRVSGLVKSVIDFSPVTGLVDRPPSPAVTNEPKPTPPKTANESSSPERADQASPPPEKADQPPPLPDKTRGAARLSLIPAAARALFSPPRRPPRASDQRTPRRKKQGSAERKAVISMPPEVIGALAEGERDRRPLSESLESPGVSIELESPARDVSVGAETPSAQKKTTLLTEFPTSAASPTQIIASSAPVLDATSREANSPSASVVRPDRRLSPESGTSTPEKKPQPVQSPQATSPPRLADVSPSKDKTSSPADVGKPAEPVTPTRGQKESTPGAGEGHTAVSPGAGAGLTEPATPTTRKKEPSDLKKKRERRRSIIQTISELFRHSTDKKEKDKDKEDKVDASPSSKRDSAAPATPPSAADSPTTPSPAAVAAGAAKATPLRNRLGLRFRKSKDKDKKLSVSPSLSPPGTPAAADVTDGRLAADLSPRPSLGSEPRPTPSGRSSPEGTLSRRSRSGRAARHSEIRRQQRAQELQRQLGEVEVRQQELQICAAELERTIRGEPREDGVQQLTDDAALMRDWFGLVHERSLLVRRDQLLQLQLQQLQLEDRHDRLQLELRERMAAPEAQKSSEDIDRERELVNTLLELSEQRRALKLAMDAEQDALRAECESAEERQQLLAAPRVPLEESTV